MSDDQKNADTSWLSALPKIVQSGLVRIKTNTALNPLLWLTAIIIMPLIVSMFLNSDLRWTLLATFIFIIICAAGAYFFLLFRDRNRLQSEEHVREMRRLELLGDDQHIGQQDTLLIEHAPLTSNTVMQSSTSQPIVAVE